MLAENTMRRQMRSSRHFGGFLLSYLINLLLRLELTIPAWILLILHFVLGIPLFWFWIALGAWAAVILLWTLLLSLLFRGSSSPTVSPENKNPYSRHTSDVIGVSSDEHEKHT